MLFFKQQLLDRTHKKKLKTWIAAAIEAEAKLQHEICNNETRREKKVKHREQKRDVKKQVLATVKNWLSQRRVARFLCWLTTCSSAWKRNKQKQKEYSRAASKYLKRHTKTMANCYKIKRTWDTQNNNDKTISVSFPLSPGCRENKYLNQFSYSKWFSMILS